MFCFLLLYCMITILNVWFSLPICTGNILWIISAVCLTNNDCGVLQHGMFSLIDMMMLGCTLNLFTLEVGNGIIGKPLSYESICFLLFPSEKLCEGNLKNPYSRWYVYVCWDLLLFFMRLWAPFIALLSDAKFIWGLFSNRNWSLTEHRFFWHITWSVCLPITDEMNAIIFTVLVKCYCLNAHGNNHSEG